MVLIKEKRPAAPVEYKSKDPWADWRPRWTEKKSPPRPAAPKNAPENTLSRATPHDFQERHAPTRAVSARQTDATQRENAARRRIVDARLWEAMTFNQQDAACAIAAAFDMLGRGMGYAASNWERIPGCRSAENVSEAHARMINGYTLWARACAKEKISHAMVLDVLCYGFSCKMIDCDRRLRNGATRLNLMKGLTLYAALQGWR